jgi:hypothetical protein
VEDNVFGLFVVYLTMLPVAETYYRVIGLTQFDVNRQAEQTTVKRGLGV